MKERVLVLGLMLLAIFAISIGCSTGSKSVISNDSQSPATQAVSTKKGSQLAASPTSKSQGATTEIALAHPEIARITCQELKRLMDKKAKITIVDARSIGAWESEHIPGSCCIPPADSSVDQDTRRDQVTAFPPDTLIVLYCD